MRSHKHSSLIKIWTRMIPIDMLNVEGRDLTRPQPQTENYRQGEMLPVGEIVLPRDECSSWCPIPKWSVLKSSEIICIQATSRGLRRLYL